ncbi:MAG: MBG-2 domain-containing protein [Micavibrio aeruginosavorus]|nr:MBG-2 domain-containing protein [Micavibrio aeruginosavorus]
MSYVGFVGGDDETDLGGALAYGGTSQGAVNVGSYGIVASGLTSSNYTIGYVDGTLTVNPARLYVTADPKTKVEGTPDPLLTYTYIGTLFGTDAFTGALERVPGETVAGGPYQINQGTLTAGKNYTIGYEPNFLTITAAPVPPAAPNPVIPTISFDPLARPVVSVANQAIVQDLPFESFEVLAMDTDVGIRAASVAAPQSNAAAVLAAIAPAAGGKGKGSAGQQQPGSVEELANLEPAAGGAGQGAPAAGTEAAGNAGDDIACANSFLDNVPCEGEAQ